jgi:hypothetical protein
VSLVAADLLLSEPELLHDRDEIVADQIYSVRIGRRVFDARNHWVGRINHLPLPHCNLKLTSTGKLVQIREIRKGEAVTFDYSMEYWVLRITGLPLSQWMVDNETASIRSRLEIFTRTHESMHDYSSLLQMPWVGSLSPSSSAVDREGLLIELEDFLDARRATGTL